MRKKQKENRDIEKFDARAREQGLTYAQLQVKESLILSGSKKKVPANYMRAGDKIRRVETPCS